jgi:hypothetical protein
MKSVWTLSFKLSCTNLPNGVTYLISTKKGDPLHPVMHSSSNTLGAMLGTGFAEGTKTGTGSGEKVGALTGLAEGRLLGSALG